MDGIATTKTRLSSIIALGLRLKNGANGRKMDGYAITWKLPPDESQLHRHHHHHPQPSMNRFIGQTTDVRMDG